MEEVIIIKWLSLKNTIEYVGEWEAMYNPGFNYTEFGIIKNAAGTDAIKESLISKTLTKLQINFVYATEADMLNMALFGKTAKQWRDANTKSAGNIRDEASLEQLVVLSNLESINSVFIKQAIPQSERLQRLNEIAIAQMRSLLKNPTVKKLTQ